MATAASLNSAEALKANKAAASRDYVCNPHLGAHLTQLDLRR